MTTLTGLQEENIAGYIYTIRGEKVMLDHDLALLYEVETKVFKQAVRRNIERFPQDFMFELTVDEYQVLRSQNVTLKRGQHAKYPPFAFTEQGVAMLSGILRSERAIHVNIAIIRTFSKMRRLLKDYQEIEKRIDKLERKYDKNFAIVFRALKQLIREDPKPRKQIGYRRSK
jgi:phage regulator Rha-like protein